MRALSLAVVALVLVGCEGKLAGPIGPQLDDAGHLLDGGCPPVGKNDEIRQALAPACAPCHTTGNKPYFASLAAFENGLAYDPKWVNPSDPAGSGLTKILEGSFAGTYPQMPPGEAYSAFVADGRVSLTIDQVKQWIATLPPRGAVNDGPAPEAFTVRRLRAEEITVSLMDQLGLTLEDFVDTSRPTWRDEELTARGGRLFVFPTDWAPGISQQYVSDKRATERYETLGGAVVLQGRKKDKGLGPSALQTVVQVSQAWCKLAIEKSGNTAVLRYVTLADKSASKSTEIKQNIAQLWLRMIGEPPADADVDELYTKVYLALEPTSTKVAWTGVCAALVRNPKWLSY
ncbi:MAG: hypothetical protein U0228_11495 [Myxococcaceae bacterium]